jgi:NADP-dependent alcohol dehydrogenase
MPVRIQEAHHVQNFTFQNPVKIIFGKGTIAQLSSLVPQDQKVLITYGGGSIKQNGVYDQVMAALKGHTVLTFGGIEPNPCYETLMEAVKLAKAEGVGFLLAVGGGSISDGTKFIAAATRYAGDDPWNIVGKGDKVVAAVPMGVVLTLPATGSEMNPTGVISRKCTQEKFPFASPLVYPQFSILDPETTYSLPPRQTANGIVDTFIHTTEQYLTYDVNTPLQDREAEAILTTLIEEAPKVKANPHDYAVRANLMWCATQALNGVIGCGVAQDWATHMIGHEMTAVFGIDHAATLAVVLPGLLRHQRVQKCGKLAQYGRRVWGIRGLSDEATADLAIQKTEAFFQEVGLPTHLSDYQLTPAACQVVADRFRERGTKLGEHQSITAKETAEILQLCA